MKTPKRIGYKQLNKMFNGFDENDPLLTVKFPSRRRYGQVDYHELIIISALIQSLLPKRVFEFGRFDGLTTLNLIKAAPKSNIFTLDLPSKNINKAKFKLSSDKVKYERTAQRIAHRRWKDAKVNDRITEILMDSASFCPRTYKGGILHKSIDLVFIDGNHNYEYVRRDTEASLEMINSKGIIIWHDYFKRSFPGVTAYIAEFAESHVVSLLSG